MDACDTKGDYVRVPVWSDTGKASTITVRPTNKITDVQKARRP